MMVAAGTSRGEESSLAERNTREITIGAEPAKAGATMATGDWLLTVQQSGFAVLPACEACEQQLCAVCCVRCRQVPNGASSAPINTMATAAR